MQYCECTNDFVNAVSYEHYAVGLFRIGTFWGKFFAGGSQQPVIERGGAL